MELDPLNDRNKFWPGRELNPRPSLLHRLSHKVRQEHIVGNEDVNCMAMNMFKYKDGLRLLQTLAV